MEVSPLELFDDEFGAEVLDSDGLLDDNEAVFAMTLGERVELLQAFDYSSDDSVLEGPFYDSLDGTELDPELVKAGRKLEMDQMREFGVYEEVDETQVQRVPGKKVWSKWLQ
eukprot:12012206-Alexandrium_andersonii.AAC.1